MQHMGFITDYAETKMCLTQSFPEKYCIFTLICFISMAECVIIERITSGFIGKLLHLSARSYKINIE
jgi:hypothetical protein